MCIPWTVDSFACERHYVFVVAKSFPSILDSQLMFRYIPNTHMIKTCFICCNKSSQSNLTSVKYFVT